MNAIPCYTINSRNKLIGIRQKLLLFLILLTPIFSISEVVALFKGVLQSQQVALTPVFIKLVKDFILSLVIFIGLVDCLIRRRILFINSYLFFIILCIISIILSYNSNSAIIVIAGIRWSLVIILIPFIYNTIDEAFQHRVAKVLAGLFFFAFVLQLFELKFLSGWYGVNSFGLSARNPGFFLIPSTMASFALFSYYYIMTYLQNRIVKRLFFVILPFSILFTGSGTGIIVYALVCFILFYRKIKQKKVILIFGLVCTFLVALLLPVITSRSDIYTSLLIRFELYGKYINMKNLFVSFDFGKGTNTGVLLAKSIEKGGQAAATVDSTILSILLNVGVVGFIVYSLFVARICNFRSRDKALFVVIFLCFMLTTVLFESFPMNVLYTLVLVDFMHKKLVLVEYTA